jgi:hypothetical protein
MIEVKHDHKLQFPTIEVPKHNEDEDDGAVIVKQTNIEGVLVPLLRFNNITITFEMVNSMKLTCNPVPTIEIEITDFLGLVKVLDTPGLDNILYLQILPPFDNAYKKIQLAFYVTNTNIDGNIITLSGTYFVPKFFDSVMKPYGIISSYDLFDGISNEYSLGFCSNVDGTTDERYIYNPNRKVMDFMNREIEFSGEKEHVYTWWIDFWNNINFVDLYKEYNEICSDEDMQIWMFNNLKATDNDENEPYKQIAAFTNSPAMVSSPLYISDYTPTSQSSLVTDCNFEVFSMNNQEASSTVIQDGDVHNDIFMKYEYGGEVFGDFDYLSQKACRNMFLNKINSQCIEVITHIPILGLMKGGHVNVWWYDINSIVAEAVENVDVESNIDVPENNEDSDDIDTSMVINKTISGQYYIIDIEYNYVGHMNWENKYILSRSAENIQRINPPSNESFMK